MSEKDKLIHRFFIDKIQGINKDQLYVAIVSSDCQDCINTNIKFIKQWDSEQRNIIYLIDPNMLEEIAKQHSDILKKSIKIDSNILIKYGITEGRMLVLYVNNNELEYFDIIPDGSKSYEFRQ
jgi:hypothetical protein